MSKQNQPNYLRYRMQPKFVLWHPPETKVKKILLKMSGDIRMVMILMSRNLNIVRLLIIQIIQNQYYNNIKSTRVERVI